MLLTAPSLDDVRAAAVRIAPLIRRTPFLPLDPLDRDQRVMLKLENLQPIGSFKLRGAANAMLSLTPDQLRHGVWTASAGNMAQGVAWCARELGVRCCVLVPDSAPDTKIASIERLGAVVTRAPFDQWWNAMVQHAWAEFDGLMIHPFEDSVVMAGNGTIAIEILDEMPDVDVVLVPWGGGGLACGISAAMSELRPAAKVVAVEVEGAAPLRASLDVGHATSIVPARTIADGIGGKSVTEGVFALAQSLRMTALSVGESALATAVRDLVIKRRVVAEGAGAASVAAVTMLPNDLRVACIVSGGNIDVNRLAKILSGEIS